MKYYAVYKGKSVIPKIYTSWDECKKDVIGFKGAIYKSFTTEKEAKEFISLNSQGRKLENIQDEESESGLFIYVDGSFTVDKGNFSYGLVAVNDGKIIYEDKGIGFDKEAIALRNVSGEVLGAKMAVEFAINNNYKEVTIAYDYQGIESWALGTWKRNNKINSELEAMAKTIYDYWFLQFEFPNEEGKPYKSSGGKMVWNDTLKRNIPENWKVQSIISNCLSSIIKPGVEIFNTKTYLATADVKGTSISTGTIVDCDGRESRANMQPSINSVWFAKMKNSIKHLYLNKEMQPIISSCILSTGFCGLQCNEISFEYIASYVSNAYFEIHKDMLAHGATQEAVNNDDLAGVHIIIPEDTVLRAYHEATQPIYAQISKNICENQELVKLRDWLLPMLMNGQTTISD